MKTTFSVIGILALVVGANFLVDWLNGDSVTKDYFDRRIEAVEATLDSLSAMVGILDEKVDRLQATADSTHSEVRVNGRKLDEIKAELDEIKTTTSNIQFRLF